MNASPFFIWNLINLEVVYLYYHLLKENNMDIKQYINDKPFLKELFQDFTETDIEKIDVMYYANDMIIIRRKASSNYVYLIISGICGIFNELDNGELSCYYKISSYDVIGLSEVLVENDVRYANIQTLTNVVALKINKLDLKKWMVKYPDFYNKIMHNIINRLHDTLRSHIECKKYSTHINVVSYLIYSYNLYKKIYGKNYKGNVKINETRNMISDFIGISIRSTNNSVERLKDENLVTVKLGKIYINYEQYKKLVEYKEKALM